MPKTVEPLMFGWAGHHLKNWEDGNPYVEYTLPIGTSCNIEEKRTIKLAEGIFMDLCLISYTNPLSKLKNRALVSPSKLSLE